MINDYIGYNNILGVKGLLPKEGTIPYWIVRKWEEQAMKPLDLFIEVKLKSYEKYIIKEVGMEMIRVLYKEVNKKTTIVKLTKPELRKKINWYLADKFKINYTPFLIEEIVKFIQSKPFGKKYMESEDDRKKITLDEMFGF